jgi:excisionase family DNA binding protein
MARNGKLGQLVYFLRPKAWLDTVESYRLPRTMASKLLTKAQAAKKAGISIRSVERYTAQGRLAVGYRGGARGKEAVYNPADVERLRDELKEGGAILLPPERRENARQAPSDAPGEALARIETQGAIALLAEAIRHATQQEGPQRGGSVALSIGDKLALTIPEAAALVGSSAHRIRAAIHAEELHAIKDSLGRGWRIRRADLEEWLANL